MQIGINFHNFHKKPVTLKNMNLLHLTIICLDKDTSLP